MIPKTLRDRLGLGRGRAIEISEHDGKIEIEPLSTPMSLVGRRGRPVAIPQGPLPALTDEVVRATLERSRR